ncbi:MAG: CYTH domain protein [Piscirickettsiaceae bacterium CG_4_9_14_3_um_filter_43_564]|nr:CYTH domain-containing protein [Thiomicrospira sp.]OIP94277.1 MAG: CYTH domain protein [Thiomicrospira sp. CG2_30_44_34]PIQ02796.1 MAG: CYTH domain protein [Piscirickettsiaceae bacterium CG18_big_fil_WC_8_21_14_2_50_44_103]PIU38610.1 MAG: CYTH domain protein [Piscirickettsiaceae bacterium CG07_land_8_20_14_0_80_44_28]PIW58466.1 MAG: CYTH domain protein [Piscirickettsiaceae bacterium CG12_big_fil_rev_8_21_14_0_65_44_934]PIW78755.1 MAG: CYTH domain protein [Piscirickettsiaceae bacterium CG_4_
MAREIERKFLIKGQAWRNLAYKKVHFAQGYLNDIHQAGSKSSIRIRIEGDQANINIKSLEIGLSRDEYEYTIDLDDAKQMLETLCVAPVIEKIRHYVTLESHIWEIDEFLGDNSGLLVAEVELRSEDDVLILPEWVTHEVTEIPRYYNVSLSQKPYCQWSPDEKQI